MKTVMIYYGGFLSRTGGAFFHAENIESVLKSKGWNVQIITLDNLPVWFRFLPHLVEKTLNLFCTPLGYLYKAYLTKMMYKFFFDDKVDLRIFEDIYLSWNSGVPSVSMLHAVWSDNLQAYSISQSRLNRFRKHEARMINETVHPVVTVSYPYRKYINEDHFSGCLSKEIDVIELGVDQTKFYDSNKMNRIKKSIIYSGTLEARKNIFFLLKVFKKVYEIDSEYTLTIVGDGPDRRRLETFVHENDLPVSFIGRVENSKVLSELLQHQIYIHTSVKESFSYSLLEAKLAGLKTCAYSKLQIPAEFIDVGFDTFDVEEWSHGILNITPESGEFDGSKYTAEKMTLSTLNLSSLEVVI